MREDNIEIKYVQKAITPFWHKLPFFFGFPFRFGPLIFMACIVAASALAGAALGAFSLIFKGFLAYLGLRYAFNVLELFSKGRFEGESMDHRLWGPEKRPAKLGLVITLFIVLGANLGNLALERRIAADPQVQERILDRYRQANAEEMAQLAREREAFNKRIGLAAEKPAAAPAPAYSGGEDEDEQDSTAAEASSEGATATPAEPPPEFGRPRDEILRDYQPDFGDALWFQLQPPWFWLAMVVASLLLPAAAVTIALEDNLLRALNPLNVVTLFQAMGVAYLALWGFFLAIAGSRQLILKTGADWPAFVRFPLEMGVATYLGLVLFAIMGYALYQYHQELHLDVDVDFDDHREAGGAEAIATAGSARAAIRQAAGPALEPWEQKVQEFARQGDFASAIAELRDRMRYDRYDVPLNAKLHALYLRQGDAAATLQHAGQYVTAMARAGHQGREWVDLLRQCRALDPEFTVQDGDAVLPAATAAMQQREFDLATSLLRGFDKRFPQHKDTAGAYFLGAKLLSEQGRQHEKAVRILRGVLHHFPEHAVAAEARVYLKVLEGMLARQGGAA